MTYGIQDKYIFTEDAAKILQISQETVQQWIQKGRLENVSGNTGGKYFLLRREAVERLRPTNRLSAREMAKCLGISQSQLNVRIKQGKIKPVSGPGIDECGTYLFLVEDHRTPMEAPP